MTAKGWGGGSQEVEGLSKKKGLMDMDNSVVIVVGRGIRRLSGNGKNTIKKLKKEKPNS